MLSTANAVLTVATTVNKVVVELAVFVMVILGAVQVISGEALSLNPVLVKLAVGGFLISLPMVAVLIPVRLALRKHQSSKCY